MAAVEVAGELALERVAQLYETLRPHLDERQRRLLLGAEAARLGRGGIKAVAGVTGAHPATVARGAREASGAPEPRTREPRTPERRTPELGLRAPGGTRAGTACFRRRRRT